MPTVCLVDSPPESSFATALKSVDLVCSEELRIEKASDLSAVPTTEYDIVLIKKERVESTFAHDVRRLRARIRSPLLIATKQLAVPAYQELSEVRGLVIVQEPFGTNALPGLIEKALQGKLLTRQCAPRFLTNEPVRVLDQKTGLILQSRMLNYSPTGAFLQYAGISLRVGSRLRLDFESTGDMRTKQHSFDAKVIWIKDATTGGKERGVGVQFMSEVSL